jgi:hypothetical protein
MTHIVGRCLEILAVIPSLRSGQALSAAKDLGVWRARSFAALRMTGGATLQSAHGKSSLQANSEN